MTEEQIKQNAEVYAEERCIRYNEQYGACYDAYIAGAHSRDEEIYDLKRDIEDLQKMVKMRSDAFECARKEIDRLSNPWISVDERLPKENCVVFVCLCGTEYLSAHYRVKSKRFITVSKDKQTLIEVRKSRATYSTCGDCLKEEYLYSRGEREDITSIVTHWMPIQELKKGEQNEK